MYIGLQKSTRLSRRMTEVAGDLRPVDFLGHERKRRGLGIARLRLELRQGNRAALQTGRSTRFSTPPLRAQPARPMAKEFRRRLARRTATIMTYVGRRPHI